MPASDFLLCGLLHGAAFRRLPAAFPAACLRRCFFRRKYTSCTIKVPVRIRFSGTAHSFVSRNGVPVRNPWILAGSAASESL